MRTAVAAAAMVLVVALAGGSVSAQEFVTEVSSGQYAEFLDAGFSFTSGIGETPVGEFENSESPYGTFDQGGNVWEWNEAIVNEWSRGLRGGGFGDVDDWLRASFRDWYTANYESPMWGFRVAEVPEPGTMLLVGTGLAALAHLARRRRG